MDWKDIADQMIEIAQKDPGFAQKLLQGPESAKKAISERGFVLPSNINISVHQNTLSELHFVLPSPATDDLLDNDALDQIAGGANKDNGIVVGVGSDYVDINGEVHHSIRRKRADGSYYDIYDDGFIQNVTG